ncbi:MAG: glycoside hydrolase family 25 protein [Bacteroidota bacterium]|nr:glycoside hydrolase family 25 protein [Bacteroidota bacterium]
MVIGVGICVYPPAFLKKYLRLKSLERLAKEEEKYYYGLPGEPVNWPTGQVLRGVDVSRYQTHVKWPEVKRNQISFVFIKATEGFYGRDRLFHKHWQRTGQAGLIRGAYHFYRPNQPAWLQALNFLTQVEIVPGDLPPVLDVEQIGYATDEELRESISTWLHWVEWRYGVKPIIYTNYNFYKDYLEGFFENYPFWIAHYKVNQLKLSDYSRKQVKFWQHTDRGAVSGIEGRVDCNVFYGSKTALEQLCLE